MVLISERLRKASCSLLDRYIIAAPKPIKKAPAKPDTAPKTKPEAPASKPVKKAPVAPAKPDTAPKTKPEAPTSKPIKKDPVAPAVSSKAITQFKQEANKRIKKGVGLLARVWFAWRGEGEVEKTPKDRLEKVKQLIKIVNPSYGYSKEDLPKGMDFISLVGEDVVDTIKAAGRPPKKKAPAKAPTKESSLAYQERTFLRGIKEYDDAITSLAEAWKASLLAVPELSEITGAEKNEIGKIFLDLIQDAWATKVHMSLSPGLILKGVGGALDALGDFVHKLYSGQPLFFGK